MVRSVLVKREHPTGSKQVKCKVPTVALKMPLLSDIALQVKASERKLYSAYLQEFLSDK